MAMLKMEWRPEYSTGHESVDFQHQYFTILINRIGANLLETKDPEYRRRLLEELVKYGEFHFTSEENVSYSNSIPGLAAHHERHMDLLTELKTHVNNLIEGVSTTEDFLLFLYNWFIGHTVYEDCKFFLQKC